MVKLTHKQLELIQVIQAHPGIKLRPMLEKAGIKYGGGSAAALVKSLITRDIIRRTGNQKNHQHYVDPNLEYELVKFSSELESKGIDSLIEDAKAVTLSTDQLFYLNNHKHQPRTKLAERLGISKLALNIYLDSLKTKTII